MPNTCTWQAAADGNWNTAGNWDVAPSANDDIIVIPSGSPAISTGPSGATTCATLTIANGAKNILTNLTVTGATSVTYTTHPAAFPALTGGTYGGTVTVTISGGTWTTTGAILWSAPVFNGNVNITVSGGTHGSTGGTGNPSYWFGGSSTINGAMAITISGGTFSGMVMITSLTTGFGASGSLSVSYSGTTPAIAPGLMTNATGIQSGGSLTMAAGMDFIVGKVACPVTCGGNNSFISASGAIEIANCTITANGNVAILPISFAITATGTVTIEQNVENADIIVGSGVTGTITVNNGDPVYPNVNKVESGTVFGYKNNRTGTYPTTATTQAARDAANAATITAAALDTDGTNTDVALGASTATIQSAALHAVALAQQIATDQAAAPAAKRRTDTALGGVAGNILATDVRADTVTGAAAGGTLNVAADNTIQVGNGVCF